MTLGFHINLFPGEESEISRLRKAWKNSEENRTAEINMLTWQVKRERERTLTLAERQKKNFGGFQRCERELGKGAHPSRSRPGKNDSARIRNERGGCTQRDRGG